ncbi:nucleotide sugar dehydrogenase [Lentzea tibetensis]|uniref:Nucleotide sugar dehydrogenase n=2 Tax=Lentzea tibetensis TaxID=2591470 RepID=A0A563EYD0_9PSEU|nr:nucleotide sugar dehydrogenase [Lentzea tibetensis]
MGYVGLPTALGLYANGVRTIGIDISARRLAAIRDGSADLLDDDRLRLIEALGDKNFLLTADTSLVSGAGAVIVCVPTPLDRYLTPDLDPLRAACASVVEHVVPGQVLVLTSTSFVGTTRELLVEPLLRRGLVPGRDVYVAFSPERIDPGRPDHLQQRTPRVVGGVTPECTARARDVLRLITPIVHPVSSAEASELTKLYENSFRAVTLALANEFAEISRCFGLDPIEVTHAAGTKPYGFLVSYPGPGVGGHCIPCDPHYLLWQLRRSRRAAPIVEEAMRSIAQRPRQVAEHAVETLSSAGRGMTGARVLVVGVSYKPGVQDLRESSALELIGELGARGALVSFHDPLVPTLELPGGRVLESVRDPRGVDWDLAVIHTIHPGFDYQWAHECPVVLDATYRFARPRHEDPGHRRRRVHRLPPDRAPAG